MLSETFGTQSKNTGNLSRVLRNYGEHTHILLFIQLEF